MSGEESELSKALAFYRSEMKAANRAWFQGKIDALYSYTHLDDKQRIDMLEPYFESVGLSVTSGHGSSITEPRRLLILPGQPGYVDLGINGDGTIEPKSPDTQTEYLEQLVQLLRQTADGDFEPPAEFAEFISMADAAAEPNFRGAECPGLGGTCWRLTPYSMPKHQAEVVGWYKDGWHVVTGWQCASEPLGVTVMLYAHKHSGTEEEQTLKWRVYTEDEDENMYAGGKWFSSIAEYLRDRCQWFHRLPAGWEHQWKPSEDSEDTDCSMDHDME